MQVNTQRTYHLSCTPEDLRLICKALGGRLKEEDIPKARELDREIAQLRIKDGEQMAQDLQKLKRNIEAEG